MPIRSRPLLEYWLSNIQALEVKNVLVNTHYRSDDVNEFIQQSVFSDSTDVVYEEALLGTAGTIRENSASFADSTLLLAHADNWSCCNYRDFVEYHQNQRPSGTVMTMMTFVCDSPSSCGIVELDDKGRVVQFHEKVSNPPGNLANAAVYLLEPAVIDWIKDHPNVSDFSTEVLPYFMGKIATWENKGVHRDIGTINELLKSQTDSCNHIQLHGKSSWQEKFEKHSIHTLIKQSEHS